MYDDVEAMIEGMSLSCGEPSFWREEELDCLADETFLDELHAELDDQAPF